MARRPPEPRPRTLLHKPGGGVYCCCPSGASLWAGFWKVLALVVIVLGILALVLL